ncbi:MAG: hypothetical protein A4E53_02324 [Pelotomaculum sp. PtaB.Bin104]|nr:MAG: hypothetical protein A4E53_02324 [Pelotomaculum sp. PtaB.Bin104]
MNKAELRNEWASRVADFQASGQSASAWCAEHNLKLHQLRYWLRKHAAAGTADATPVQWLSLDLRKPGSYSPLVIKVGQVAVEVRPGFDPDLLLKVVRALGTKC